MGTTLGGMLSNIVGGNVGRSLPLTVIFIYQSGQ